MDVPHSPCGSLILPGDSLRHICMVTDAVCSYGVCFNGGQCQEGSTQLCDCPAGFNGPSCQYGKCLRATFCRSCTYHYSISHTYNQEGDRHSKLLGQSLKRHVLTGRATDTAHAKGQRAIPRGPRDNF
ncbi:hypothetical protein PAMP_017570 [Pampus punctatissimus]